jgi:hypothetical protein
LNSSCCYVLANLDSSCGYGWAPPFEIWVPVVATVEYRSRSFSPSWPLKICLWNWSSVRSMSDEISPSLRIPAILALNPTGRRCCQSLRRS